MQPRFPAIRHLVPTDDEWPSPLSELRDPPVRLSVQGELPKLTQAIAIVGTRSPDARASDFAHSLAVELAREGRAIISGGALGIDSAAHSGALDAGGLTVAVLATGLEKPYPAENIGLFAQIAERGALLSEHADGLPGYPSVFLARNRVIAALASVVIVVQAPLKSGALSTAAHAIKLGRVLMAVPFAPWEPRGAGCLTLLADGARVCRTSADVLSLAAPTGQQAPRPQPRRPRKAQRYPPLDEDERGVITALGAASLSADELCESTGLSAPRVQRAVLMLLLSRVIREVGCGRYARIAEF